MWKCPACETLNNENICAICGEPRPEGAEIRAPKAKSVDELVMPEIEKYDIPAYSPERAKKTSDSWDGLDPTPRLEYMPEKDKSESSNFGLAVVGMILGLILLIVIIAAFSASATDEGLNTTYYGELSEQNTVAAAYDLLTE